MDAFIDAHSCFRRFSVGVYLAARSYPCFYGNDLCGLRMGFDVEKSVRENNRRPTATRHNPGRPAIWNSRYRLDVFVGCGQCKFRPQEHTISLHFQIQKRGGRPPFNVS